MLIPNKYSGYQPSGVRLYPIGGGVGEAMLLGAAMGGGSAALTGGDPLKGALLGGLTGGIGGGITSGINALTPAATEAATAGAASAGAGASAANTGIAGLDAFGDTAASMAKNIAQNPNLYPAGSLAPNTATMFMPGASPAATAGIPGAVPTGTASALNPTSALNPAVTTSAAPTGQAFAIPSQGSNVIPAASAPGGGTFTEGMARFANNPLASLKANPFTAAASGIAGAMGAQDEPDMPGEYEGPLKRFKFNPDSYRPAFAAEGGIMSLAGGGYDRMVGGPSTQYMANGGISSLGSYSDGGRMLRGPGDGMSDSIPASIGGRRPARLADGEFVVPADVVSHLGNGSTDAGAKQLYAMMDKVRSARTGTKKQGRQIAPQRYMPA